MHDSGPQQLEDALELFKLPRVLGETAEGEEVSVNIGRFGPYVKYGKSYVSLKDDDPYSVGLERALELIEETDFGLSAQVLQEFYVNVTRKIASPLMPDAAIELVEQFRLFPLVHTDHPLIVHIADPEHLADVAAAISAEMGAPIALATCERCGSRKLPHTVCSTCGTYDKRQVLDV